jgi:hypothetical protein
MIAAAIYPVAFAHCFVNVRVGVHIHVTGELTFSVAVGAGKSGAPSTVFLQRIFHLHLIEKALFNVFNLFSC